MTLKEWREEIESSCRFTLEHEGKPYEGGFIERLGLPSAIRETSTIPSGGYRSPRVER